jgi:hypothetical protein
LYLYEYYKIRTGNDTEGPIQKVKKISDNIHSSTILQEINLGTIWSIHADHKYSINKKKLNKHFIYSFILYKKILTLVRTKQVNIHTISIKKITSLIKMLILKMHDGELAA